MYTAEGGGGEDIFNNPPRDQKKWPPPPPPPQPHPVLTKKVKRCQYDDDNGTEITDLTLHAFKLGNG